MMKEQNRKNPQNVPPPWMQGAKKIEGQEMLIVHMNDGELEGLDNLQGGPSIDPETGIREYSALASIIEIPEVKKVFYHVYDEIEKNGDISPDLKKIYESAKEHSLPYKSAPEEKHDPLKSIEHTGRKGDTKLALIPLNLAFLLIELRHEPSINPKTGLLEFGGAIKKIWKPIQRIAKSIFQNPIRTAGTVAGLMLAGPFGAGLGTTVGGLLQGDDFGNSLQKGFMVGGAGYGLQGLGQAAGLSAATPYTAGFFGGAPNAIAQGIGSVGIPGLPHAAASPFSLNPLTQLQQTLASAPASGGGISGMIPASLQGAWRMAKDNAHWALPLGTLGMTTLGSQKQYQQDKKRYEEALKDQREEEEAYEEEKRKSGFYDPWKEPASRKRHYNPRFHQVSDLESKYGIFSAPSFKEERGEERGYAKGGLVQSYSKGTLVKGPGKGQDDKIKTSVPEGSYIIDASSTSMFGDGSTKAGSDSLRAFENAIKKKFSERIQKQVEKQVYKNSSQLPVWLSEGEYKIDPVTVTLLGKGSNDKGASLLKEMVIKLRKHKISKGSSLPPKANPPAYYIDG